jgi:hypothetical protein
LREWDLEEKVYQYISSGQLARDVTKFYSITVADTSEHPWVSATKTPLGFSLAIDLGEIFICDDFLVCSLNGEIKLKHIGAQVAVFGEYEYGRVSTGITTDYI